MSSQTRTPDAAQDSPRRRLPRDERLRQLLDVSWTLIRDEGADALTLGRLADAAGVTKPVVYDHFGTRNGLLAALYQDFDVRQTALIDAAIAASKPTLKDKAHVIAASYIECVLTQGREIPGVLAALGGSPELAAVKRQYQQAFIEKCQTILAPFAGPQGVSLASLWAMLGAADALSQAAVAGDINEEQARDELMETILAMVKRSK
ncbi:TetR family regulatory protein [Azotobacter vinelandii CA]|uniref:Bacterial regulatory protein, TetR n=2 Tax=Azotobacter vinelandii TaxID=354 RepID=C1DR67_AZOVD|nr:TetR/AcrR family transcriptional regulator [Azotobacter vinelandii]ACO79725.1 Bacterial regulatory protein, TetR [Azotobacter vinelandii DJ]AGK14591.1 TetR family regulatory protein [Azotobacter vinelandii CA]AGK21444.1 TetR family regulatory protein [Azotobacter vinelandii CA6]SFY23359.1 transcriptional regulator, TetR family [Azotobacter vinelandii]